MRPQVLASIALVFAASCAPTFDAQSALVIDGAPYQPTACQVHAGAYGGVTFIDAHGARLTLALPPQRLDFAGEIGGTPEVRWEPQTNEIKPALEVGTCGSVTLRGEGYHGQGRRAASGHATLGCTAGAKISGEIRWSGCF
jgi:hypothetical protein